MAWGCPKHEYRGLSTQSRRVLIIDTLAAKFKGFMTRTALFCSLLVLTHGVFGADVPAAVRQALRQAGIPDSSASIVVQDVGAARPDLAFNAGEPRNPASVMKLVTTYAALELLGPAFRWKTEAYLDGARRGDVLEGNLVLRGYGDPKLTYEGFWLMLRGLRARGLREIRGDLVLDRSYFGAVAPMLIDDETFRPYNVVPDALLVNFKSLRFTFAPEPDGSAVRVFAEPALPGLEITNTLHVSNGACPEGRAFRDLIQASFQNGTAPRASFTGRYPASCAERDLNVALYAPREYLAGMLRQLWTELGGTWQGGVREGTVPNDSRPALVHESPPLAEIVRDINKFSNNVMARQLYLTLAAELGGAPARPEAAFDAIKDWLKTKNISAPELVMENGSGLSRNERITAATLARILDAAWASPLMPELLASMPIAATDGTMRRRLRGDPLAGQAHVKTGLLNDARSIAGYVQDRNGARHIVVMIVNHPSAPQSDAAMDALLRWVYENGAATTRGLSRSRRPGALPRHP